MKMYKKTKCEFVENRIMHKDNVVAIPSDVFALFESLEENLQKARYLMDQPRAVKAPSLDGFKRQHASSLPMLKDPITPVSDEQLMKSMALMDEMDSINVVQHVNKTILQMRALVDWCESKFVIDDADGTIDKFDLEMIGNPLEVTGSDIVAYIMEIESADRWASSIDFEPIVSAQMED